MVLYKRPSILLTDNLTFSRCGITLIFFPLPLIKIGDQRGLLFSVCYGVTQSKLSAPECEASLSALLPSIKDEL